MNTVGEPLSGESIDQPSAVIEQLSSRKLVRVCTGWRFTFAVTEATNSDGLGVGLREFWRQFASACLGRLTGWAPTFEGFSNSTLPAPTTAQTWESIDTTKRSGDTTTHVVGSSTLFEINSARLSSQARRELAATVRDVQTARAVTVTGYTDATTVPGDPSYNQQLSTARAKAVAQLLRDSGLPSGARLTVVGRGAADPIAPDTEAERYRNRRVEIAVTH